MRFVSSVLKALAGLVALVVLVYLAVNGIAVAQGLSARHRLADEVTDRIADELPAAEVAQQELVDGAEREPDRRWIEQTCEFGTDDAGWMVQNHRETCVLRSVAAWRVDSEEEARRMSGVPGEGYAANNGCLPLDLAGAVEGREATYVDHAASSDGEPWCTRELGQGRGSREIAGDRQALDPGRWLVVTAAQPLVDEPIGCAHWSVLFCDNPWTGHAFGEAPAD